MSIENEMYQQEQAQSSQPVQPEQQPSGGLSLNLSFLKAPTGEGAVEDYLEDPLNFDKSESTARILRGFTGLLGSINLALIDIVIGFLQKIKERKSNAPVQ